MCRARQSIASRSSFNNSFRPIETLESRRLLAVAVNSGVLTITGTGGADTYVVTRSGSNIVVVENGGGPQNFAVGSVTSITASLGGGSDSLLISDDVTQRSTINGEAGNDTLDGGGGDDVIDGGIGNDSIDGGAGNDTVSYASRSEAITGTLGIDYTALSGEAVPLIAYSGTAGATGEADTFIAVETLAGGSGNDTLSDTVENFIGGTAPIHTLTIVGNGGNDTLNIEGGGRNARDPGGPADNFLPSYPYVTAYGDAGNDVIQFLGSRNGTTLFGGDGDDTFLSVSDGETAILIGGLGFDTYDVSATDLGTYRMPDDLEKMIARGNLSVTIIGNDFDNVIEATISRATIFGGGGNDLITRVSTGDDEIHGGDGNDTIYAGEGNDRVYGDAGDDRLNGDGGKDSIYGGDGDDRVYGNSGSDRLFGDAGIDRLYGGNKNDYLDGGAGADYIKGDEDTDTAKNDKKDRRYESIEIFV
jgi:Ca2+-binding RTX toxin-like protein